MEPIGLTFDLTPWAPQLERACAADIWGLTLDDLRRGVADGTFLALQIRGQAVAVVEKRPVRDGISLCVAALAGSGMVNWLDELLAALDRLAREQGCCTVLAYGRPGWRRALRRRGDIAA